MLKFAEAKNAGLIVLNLTAIIALLQLDSDNLLKFFIWIKYYIVALNFCSTFFCLVGIYAQLRTSERKPAFDGNENLLYFGDIALMTPKEMLQKTSKKYNCNSINLPFDEDLCRQIVIVSQIALRKFRIFNIAMYFTIASIPPTIVCYWLFSKFFYPNK